MLTECFNPACRKKLDYLRNGRVVRMVPTSSTSTKSVNTTGCAGAATVNLILSSSPTVQWLFAPRGGQSPPA